MNVPTNTVNHMMVTATVVARRIHFSVVGDQVRRHPCVGEGQHDTEQQRVGSLVPGEARTHVAGEACDADPDPRDAEGDHQRGDPAAFDHEDHHEHAEQVEVLLDGQRPELDQRADRCLAATDELGVDRMHHVVHVRAAGQRVADGPVEQLALVEQQVDGEEGEDRRDEHQVHQRQQAQRSS